MDDKFVLTSSRRFPDWLAARKASLAFSTYQANKLLLVGVRENGRLSIFERTFPRSMGIAVSRRSMWLASESQIYRFDNVIPEGHTTPEGFDALFGPHQSWITGDLDIHDLAIGANGLPLFVATRFSCLATVGEGYSFRPIWKPPFISRIAAEDRCHLNGMATEDGAPKYATAVSRSDVADGWRDRRADGGIVIEVESGEIVAQGLSMPHSPRLHDGRLYLLNSGTGEFGWIDRETGVFEPIAFCPGYARGLSFIDDWAVIGLSQARENRTFSDLPLAEALEKRDVDARCGLAIVNLRSGEMVHWVRIEGIVSELFDVAILRGTGRPSLIGFKSDEILRVISIDDSQAV